MDVKINEAEKTVTIVMPLQAPEPSSTGKSLLIANSGGPVKTSATFNGKPVTFTGNVYIKA